MPHDGKAVVQQKSVMWQFYLAPNDILQTEIAKIRWKKRIYERNVGDNKSCVPKCPPEKEKAIMAAFKHFNMI